MDTKTLHFSALSPEEAAHGKEEKKVDETVLRSVRLAIEGYGGKATLKQIADWTEWPMTTTSRRVQLLRESGAIAESGEKAESEGRSAVLYRLTDF